MGKNSIVLLAGCLLGVIGVVAWQNRPHWQNRPADYNEERGWVSHNDGRFRARTPSGWTAVRDPQSGRVTFQAREGIRIVVWPVLLPEPVAPGLAATVLRHLANSVAGQAEWGNPQPIGSNVVSMTGRAAASALVSAFQWTPARRGAAGFFYLVSAPEAAMRGRREELAQILASFQALGAPDEAGGNAASGLRYSRWTDPRENAFSIEVPEGWKVQGGLVRYASVDVRGVWEVLSPAGDIRILGGDADLPVFTEPSPMLAATGFPEGSWYSPGYGVRLMVRRYVPGQAFSAEYALNKAGKFCAGVQITSNRDLPQATEAINAVYSQYGGMGFDMRLTAGEASLRCSSGQGPMSGYFFAGIQRTLVPGMPGGLWKAEYLAGYLATESKAAQAHAVLHHILQSFQINPQWAAMQQGLTANTSQIVSRTHSEISSIINSTYQYRQQVLDEIDRRRSNAILTQEDVIDTMTGRQIKVESGSNYYWIDHRGTIVGTETHARPSLDFRELLRLP